MKQLITVFRKTSYFLYFLLAAFVTWWKATMLDYPYWRVTYKDGKRTRLLYWREAKGLKEVFNGKLWIDYNC